MAGASVRSSQQRVSRRVPRPAGYEPPLANGAPSSATGSGGGPTQSGRIPVMAAHQRKLLERAELPTPAPPAITVAPSVAPPAAGQPAQGVSRARVLGALLGAAMGFFLTPVVMAAWNRPTALTLQETGGLGAHAATEQRTPLFSWAPAETSGKKAKRGARRRVGARKRTGARAQAAALRTLKGRLRRCAGGKPGKALLHLSVRSTGKVTYARVYGPNTDGQAGSCMAKAARGLYLDATPGGGMRQLERSISW